MRQPSHGRGSRIARARLAPAGRGLAPRRHCARSARVAAYMKGIVPTLAGAGRGPCNGRDRVHAKPAARCPREAVVRRLTSTSRGSACASTGLCSRPRHAGETTECVANQESHARSKQQREDPRQLRPVRLAHCPGDPVVPPGATRLLSAWLCDSRAFAPRDPNAIVTPVGPRDRMREKAFVRLRRSGTIPLAHRAGRRTARRRLRRHQRWAPSRSACSACERHWCGLPLRRADPAVSADAATALLLVLFDTRVSPCRRGRVRDAAEAGVLAPRRGWSKGRRSGANAPPGDRRDKNVRPFL
jgi:hypothetical protein